MNVKYPDPHPARPAWLRYAVASAAALVALPLRLLLGPQLGFVAPFVTFFPAVIFSSWYGGFGPSVVSAFIGSLLGLYFFVPPILSFDFTTGRDLWGTVRFFGGSVAISWLLQKLLIIRQREQRQQRFAAVTLASIGDAVLTTDTSGHVTFMNAVAATLTGWTPDEAVGRRCGDVLRIFDEQTGAFIPDPTAEVLGKGAQLSLSPSALLETKSGDRIPVDDSRAPIKDETGRTVGAVLVFRDTAERRKAEQQRQAAEHQLAESQKQMSTMLASISDGFAALDRDWRYTYVNAEAARQLGKTPAELIGHSIGELFPRGLPAPLPHSLEQAMSGQSPETCEVILPARSTTYRFRVFPSPDGLAIYSVDIGIEKTAAAANALLAAIVESSNEAIIGNGIDGIVTAWNHGAERMFGYSAAEMIGCPVTVLGAPGRFDETPRILKCIEQGERVEHFETVRRAKDGRLLDVSLTVSPICDPQGRVIGASALAHDITERKASFEALRNSETRLGIALEAGSMGVWEWHIPDGRVEWSPQLEAIHGLQPGAFAGTFEAFQSDVHPDDVPRVLERIQTALQSGNEYRNEYRIIRPDGKITWLESRGRIGFNANREPDRIVGICMDITASKAAEDELLRQAERLVRSNADLRSFAYAASHDLQEPLRIISAFSELLLRRYRGKLDAGADELIGTVVDASLRMGTLIKDLLNYSRLINDVDIPAAEVDLNEVLKWAIDNVQTAIDESRASIQAAPLPCVRGDRVQLSQLFQNLIGNAVKYRGSAPPEIRIAAEQRNGEWVLSVRDNGLGIDPDYHEKIFGVFKRLHGSEYPGTGIGLALCKRIVEKHGGRIWVESEKGKGSTFYFSLAVPASAADDRFSSSAKSSS